MAVLASNLGQPFLAGGGQLGATLSAVQIKPGQLRVLLRLL